MASNWRHGKKIPKVTICELREEVLHLLHDCAWVPTGAVTTEVTFPGSGRNTQHVFILINALAPDYHGHLRLTEAPPPLQNQIRNW
jgi:hypothetical protein